MRRTHIYSLVFIIIIIVFIIYIILLKDTLVLKSKENKYYKQNLYNVNTINKEIHNDELKFLIKNYCFLLNNKNDLCSKESA